MRGGMYHEYRVGGWRDDVHGMRDRQILDGIGRRLVHRLRCGVDHEHGPCNRRELMYSVRRGHVLEGIKRSIMLQLWCRLGDE